MAVVKDPNGDRTAESVRDAAVQNIAEVLQRLKTSPNGLSDEVAAKRLDVFGANEVAQVIRHRHRQDTPARRFVMRHKPAILEIDDMIGSNRSRGIWNGFVPGPDLPGKDWRIVPFTANAAATQAFAHKIPRIGGLIRVIAGRPGLP